MILKHFVANEVGQIVSLRMVHDLVSIQKVQDNSTVLLVCLPRKASYDIIQSMNLVIVLYTSSTP